LTNAVYFKGAWTKQFNLDATQENGEFKLAGGAHLKIAMMQQSGRFSYAEDANLQALELPYGNGQIAMYILLPKAQSDFQKFLTGLTLKDFEKIVDKMQIASGTLTLPRFSISYENELSNDLKSMGMPAAFDSRTADFKAMADVPSSFFIGQVLHKAIMNVNEAGTEAAAATAIVMATAIYIPGKPFVMNVDHPFVVAIRERDSKQILFLGAVANPEKLAAPKLVDQLGRNWSSTTRWAMLPTLLKTSSGTSFMRSSTFTAMTISAPIFFACSTGRLATTPPST
jgi:serpin B